MSLEDNLFSPKVKGVIAGALTAVGIDGTYHLLQHLDTSVIPIIPYYIHALSAITGLAVAHYQNGFFEGEDVAKKLGIDISRKKEKSESWMSKASDPGIIGVGSAVVGSLVFNTFLADLYFGADLSKIGDANAKSFESWWKGISVVFPLPLGLISFILANIGKFLFGSRKELPKIVVASGKYILTKEVSENDYHESYMESGFGWSIMMTRSALREKRYGAALHYAKKAIANDQSMSRLAHESFVRQLAEMDLDGSGNLTLDQSIQAGVCASLLGDGQRAAELFEEASQKDSLIADLICAQFFDGNLSQQYFEKAAKKVVDKKEDSLVEKTESTNKVFFVDEKYFDEIFVYKQGDEKEIESEKDFVQQSKDILETQGYQVRQSYVTTIDIGGERFGVWEYIRGTNLDDLIRKDPQSAFSYLMGAAKMTGILLGGLDKRGNKPDLRAKAHKKVDQIVSSLDPSKGLGSLADQIAECFDPIVGSYDLVPWVKRKDSHPENVMCYQKKIGDQSCSLIDFGASDDLIPLNCETANLLAYVPVFSKDQVQQVLYAVGDGFNRSSDEKVQMGKLMLAHPNGVIQRAIDLAGAWSSPSRISLWPRRSLIIGYAIEQIHVLRDDFPEYVARFNQQYIGLEDGLFKLSNALNDDKRTSM